MLEIINEYAIDRLKETFNDEQIREISFALNPDSENLDWTIYHIEQNKMELDKEIMDLKERVTDLAKLVMDHRLIDHDEFIESLTCHVDELVIVANSLSEDEE